MCKKGERMKDCACERARRSFVGLHEVVLTDAYCANALEKEYAYLTAVDSDKLLYWFYRNAACTPRAEQGYGGGWESALIGGHTLGHYLTALAQGACNRAFSSKQRAKLQEIACSIVTELRLCQSNAVPAGAHEGFLWGARSLSYPEEQFDNVERGKTDITTQAWVPWYTMHKLLSGLYAVATLCNSQTAKQVLLALSDWVCARVSGWSAQTRKQTLSIEYGGMNDILYAVYALTGEEKYAVAAHAFDEEDLFARIVKGDADYLDGVHANTTIPKILGALNRYAVLHGKELAGERIDAAACLCVAERFFDRVVSAHTYATGGNSEWEHFGKDGVLDKERTNCNCETCNTYNMLKLARLLFAVTGKKQYLDYYENTYYNAILSSQNPRTGMTTYFQPMASGYFKTYSSPENSFWCCTGSGMESMTKLQDSVYYAAQGAVYVSLYLSSVYEGKEIVLAQQADLERSDDVFFKVRGGAAQLFLRVPDWAAETALYVNGERVETTAREGFFCVGVRSGDKLRLTLKKRVTACTLPDGAGVYAFRYGPFLLSAELGTMNMETEYTGVNVTIAKRAAQTKKYRVPYPTAAAFAENIDGAMQRLGNGMFRLVCENGELTYSLHYKQHLQRYGIYMRFAGKGDQA